MGVPDFREISEREEILFHEPNVSHLSSSTLNCDPLEYAAIKFMILETIVSFKGCDFRN